MKEINVKDIEIKPHQIIVATTSKPDYEMNRYILLEIEYNRYVVIEGSHCSCYDFDDTEWTAMEYTSDEIKKLSKGDYDYDENERHFWQMVQLQF